MGDLALVERLFRGWGVVLHFLVFQSGFDWGRLGDRNGERKGGKGAMKDGWEGSRAAFRSILLALLLSVFEGTRMIGSSQLCDGDEMIRVVDG